jgi:hypothetical protein
LCLLRLFAAIPIAEFRLKAQSLLIARN